MLFHIFRKFTVDHIEWFPRLGYLADNHDHSRLFRPEHAVLRDRNFVIGLLLIFVFGVAVFSSLFVLPLFLQNVQGYPVLSAGWVVSARGLGTMAAMLASGYLTDRVRPRQLILASLACVGLSNLWMTGWTAEVSMTEVVWQTIVNGFGMGMMWVVLTTVTFSTLAPSFRVEAAALFSLVRAIGASMGTSVIVAIMVRSAQVNYIELRGHVHEYNENLARAGRSTMFDIDDTRGLMALRELVNAEALTIAFLNDFVFLTIVALAALPLVFLFKRPRE